jgi:hypothetical protein
MSIIILVALQRLSEGLYVAPGQGVRARDFKITGHQVWVEGENGKAR